MSEEGSWMQDYVDTSSSLSAHRYSVPRAMSEGRSNVSPGVAVSIDEKVSDLIQSYPHLRVLLKSQSNNASARIRDLEISSHERDRLLLQIIAARRQQQLASGASGPASQPARGAQLPPRMHQSRRKKPAQAWVKRSAQLSMVTGKWHRRFWG